MLIFDYNLVSIRNFFGGFKEKASKVKFVDKKYEKDDYINLKKKDGTSEGNKEAKKEDTSEDNNKIKILDFMKNSSLNDIEDNKKVRRTRNSLEVSGQRSVLACAPHEMHEVMEGHA